MRLNRSTPRIALAILVALGTGLLGLGVASATVTPRPPTPPSVRLTFGIQPATKGVPDSRASYRYAVTPGGVLHDQVAVRNLSASPATFRIYATDAVNVDNGGFGLLPRAQRPHDVGSWVKVGGRASRGTVTVKPRSVVVLPLSLKVPHNAQPGDHTGGIVVSVTTRTRNATGTNTELEQRVGARMYVRVSGPLRPALTIKPVQASYWGVMNPFGGGRTEISYRVKNTGNVNLGGRQRVSIQALLGPALDSSAIPNAQLLLPGGSMDVKTSVLGLWPLLHERATVTLDPMLLQGDVVPGLSAYSASTVFWAVPWSLLVALAVLLVAVLLRMGLRPSIPRPNVSGLLTKVVAAGGRWRRRLRVGVSSRVAMLVAAVAAALLLSPAAAYADDVPFTDVSASGGLTFCNAKGQPVTSGSIDRAISATVVSGRAAPPPYDGNGRTAGLFAFQPRRGVEPTEWSGQGMTALSRYSNPTHPMVEILPRDYTLGGFAEAYPPEWDGLVQLRVFLRAPNQPTATSTYAASTVRITGGTWEQVGPQAGAPCTVGRAESVIRLLGLPTAGPSSTTSPSVSARSAAPAAPDVLAHAERSSSLSSVAAGDDPTQLIWVGVVAGLMLMALVLWGLVRRRQPG